MSKKTLESALLSNFQIPRNRIYNLGIVDFKRCDMFYKFGSSDSHMWDGASVILASDPLSAKIHYAFDQFETDKVCLILLEDMYECLSDEERKLCDIVYDCYSNRNLITYNDNIFSDSLKVKCKMNLPESIRIARNVHNVIKNTNYILKSESFITDFQIGILKYQYAKNFLEVMFKDLPRLPDYNELSSHVRFALYFWDDMLIEHGDLVYVPEDEKIINMYDSRVCETRDKIDKSLIGVKLPIHLFKSRVSLYRRIKILKDHLRDDLNIEL